MGGDREIQEGAEIRCVCFDLGGVLLRVQLWYHDHYRIFRDYGVSLDHLSSKIEAVHSLVLTFTVGRCSEHEYLIKLCKILGVDREVALALHMSILREPYKGTFEIIKKLKNEKIYTACLSNTNELHWKRISDPCVYPAVGLLDKRVASFECDSLKPQREIFERFEQLVGFHGRQVLFFDDVEENIEVAHEYHWLAKRVDPTKETAPQILEVLKKFDLFR